MCRALLVLAVVSLSCRCAIAYDPSGPYPIYKLDGYSYNVGYVTGVQGRDLIIQGIAADIEIQTRLIPFYKTEWGRKVFNAFNETYATKYPEYYQETLGTADGAGVPVEWLIMSNFRDEIEAFNNITSEPRLLSTHCSDVATRFPDSSLIWGHNEDDDPYFRNYSYFVNQTVYYRDGDWASFVAFTTAGQMPGFTFGFTQTGLLLSQNALFPKTMVLGGIPIGCIGRDLYSAQSIEDALSRVCVPQANGASFNIYSVKENRMVNIETSPDTCTLYEIKVPAAGDVTSYYHANNYVHSNVSFVDDPSSDHRMTRMKQMPVPLVPKDIQAILGDTSDPVYPLYRNGLGIDDTMTLATALFLPSQNIMRVFTANPKLFPDAHSDFSLYLPPGDVQ